MSLTQSFIIHWFALQASQRSDLSKSDTVPLFISIYSPEADKPRFTERTYAVYVSEYVEINSTILNMAINYNIQVWQ